MKTLGSGSRNTFNFEIMTIFLVNSFLFIQAFLNGKRFYAEVTPAGDPFTYSIGYFDLLNRVKDNFGALLETFTALFLGNINWYWLTDLLIILLNPFLIKEMYSLILINYVLYFVWCVYLFFLAKLYVANRFSRIVFSLLPWLFPMNYGLAEYSSPGTMGLDAAFVPMLGIALTGMFLMYANPRNNKYALQAALLCVLAVFGRGNSLPVVLLVIFVPTLFLLIWSKKNSSYSSMRRFLIIFSLSTFYFYFTNWGPISSYYNNHLQFIERQQLNFNDFKPYLLNIPGFMFSRSQDSIFTIFISFALHLLVLATAVYLLKSIRKLADFNLRSIIRFTGVFVYFGTYFINLLLFTDPLMNIYNALLIWRPMLLGLLCILISFFPEKGFFESRVKLVAFLTFLVIFSSFFTLRQTPWEWKINRPDPASLQQLVRKLSTSQSISVIWYGNINPQILDYFYIKENNKHLNVFRGPNYNSLWSPWDYSDENRALVSKEIIQHFNEASIVILPEYLTQYQLGQPYAINHFREIFLELYSKELLPQMTVVGQIKENDRENLLVLSKSENAESQEIWKPVMAVNE
jgi:hypothetical protein